MSVNDTIISAVPREGIRPALLPVVTGLSRAEIEPRLESLCATKRLRMAAGRIWRVTPLPDINDPEPAPKPQAAPFVGPPKPMPTKSIAYKPSLSRGPRFVGPPAPSTEHLNLAVRVAARDAGLKHYMPVRPCRRGHMSHRRVSDGHCLECHRVAEAKQWKKEKQQRIREQNRIARATGSPRPRRPNQTPNYAARDAARDAGLKHYMPVVTCFNGHKGPRRVKDNTCLECDQERGQRRLAALTEEEKRKRAQYQANKQAALRHIQLAASEGDPIRALKTKHKFQQIHQKLNERARAQHE